MINAKHVINLLGTYWSDFVNVNGELTNLFSAWTDLAENQQLELNDVINSADRININIYSRRKYLAYSLNVADINILDTAFFKLDKGYNLNSSSQPQRLSEIFPDTYVAKKPTNLKNFSYICDNIAAPTIIGFNHIDVWIDGDCLSFSPTFIKKIFPNLDTSSIPYSNSNSFVLQNLTIVDAEIDNSLLKKTFGLAINYLMDTSEEYKTLVNAAWDSYCDGGTYKNIIDFLGAVLETPIATLTEQTRARGTDVYYKWVATDNEVFKIPKTHEWLEKTKVYASKPVSQSFNILSVAQAKEIIPYINVRSSLDKSNLNSDIKAYNKLVKPVKGSYGLQFDLECNSNYKLTKFWRFYHENAPIPVDSSGNKITTSLSNGDYYIQNSLNDQGFINPFIFFYENMLQYSTTFIFIKLYEGSTYKLLPYLSKLRDAICPQKNIVCYVATYNAKGIMTESYMI